MLRTPLFALRPVLCIVVILLGVHVRVSAQDTAGVGQVAGQVLDAAAAPAEGVTVCLARASSCATTAADGRFLLRDLRPGVYPLTIAAPGLPAYPGGDVDVRAGLETVVEIVLPPLDNLSQTVTVSAPVFNPPEEIKNSSFLVQQVEIARSAGALQDVSRYVQTLPGVAIGSNDFRNDLIVRGGSPLENLFIVDNVEIPNINNFANFAAAGGSVGMLDPEVIRDVEFLTGGYPASFGNRLSSVLQVSLREGSRERTQARATVGYAGAGLVAEGPITGGRGSWIVSGRRSFLDAFTDDIGLGGVPVNYSVNAKVVYDLTARDRIWVLNVGGLDRIRLGPTEDNRQDDELGTLDIRYDGWRTAVGVNWQRLLGRGVSLLGVTHSEAAVDQSVKDLVRFDTVGESVDDLIARSPVVYRENSREGETTLKYDLTLQVPHMGTLQAGAALELVRIDYDAAQPLGNDSPYTAARDVNAFALREQFFTTQTGAYVQATRALGSRLNLTAGLRFDRYAYIAAHRASPRAAVSYQLTKRLSWRTSGGVYHQQPFFLFLTAFPGNRALGPTRATHLVTGLTAQTSERVRWSVEAYRKEYRDYPVAANLPSVSLANTGDTFAVSDLLFPLTSDGRGRSAGVELFVEKKPSNGWYGQMNLALSRTRHAARDGVLRAGSFDYPVVFNAVGGTRIGTRWDASVRLVSLSGRPYTPFDTATSTAQRRGVYDLTRVNDVRLPQYVRVDVRIDRTFEVGGRSLRLFLGVQNITGRRNVAEASWDRQQNRPTFSEQLGRFPLLGLEGRLW